MDRRRVVHLPDAGDLADVDGELLAYARRPGALDIYVVREHREARNLAVGPPFMA